MYSSENLRASWEKVRSNGGAAGVDRYSIEAFEKEAEKNLVGIVFDDGFAHRLGQMNFFVLKVGKNP